MSPVVGVRDDVDDRGDATNIDGGRYDAEVGYITSEMDEFAATLD